MKSSSNKVKQGVINVVEKNEGTIDVDVSYNINLRLDKFVINLYVIVPAAAVLFILGDYITELLSLRSDEIDGITWELLIEILIRIGLFTFLIPLIREYINKRAARKLQLKSANSINLKSAKQGYFKTTPYKDEDAAHYKRPDLPEDELKNWVKNNLGERYLYLTGRSGAGKSSFINCRLVPVLKRAGYKVQCLNLREDENVLSVLKKIETTSLTEENGVKKILVIDQFEELFYQKEDSLEIWEILLIHANQRLKNVLIIVSIRDDYKEELSIYGLPALLQNKNWKPLNEYDNETALSFIQKKIAIKNETKLSLLIQDEFARVDKKPGYVTLITLNMIGLALEFINESGFTAAKIKSAFDSGLINFYLKTVCGRREVSPYISKIFNILVTSKLVSTRLSTAAIAKELKQSVETTRGVLTILKGYGLIFQSSNDTWSIAHDFIRDTLYENLRNKKIIPATKIFAVLIIPVLSIIIGATATVAIFYGQHNTYHISHHINELNKLGIAVDLEEKRISISHSNRSRLDEELTTKILMNLWSIRDVNIEEFKIRQLFGGNQAKKTINQICSIFKPKKIHIETSNLNPKRLAIEKSLESCRPKIFEIHAPTITHIPKSIFSDDLKVLNIRTARISSPLEMDGTLYSLENLQIYSTVDDNSVLFDNIVAKNVFWNSPAPLPDHIQKLASSIILYVNNKSKTDICSVDFEKTTLKHIIGPDLPTFALPSNLIYEGEISSTNALMASSFIGEITQSLLIDCNIRKNQLNDYSITLEFKDGSGVPNAPINLAKYTECWESSNDKNYISFFSCLGLPTENLRIQPDPVEKIYQP